MPADVAAKVYRNNQHFYDSLAASPLASIVVKCSVLLLSACQDDEITRDGPMNSVFTSALLATWDSGRYRGTYARFRDEIKKRIANSRQTPNYFTVGTPNPIFEAQTPFTI
jgi:hypothetical protein